MTEILAAEAATDAAPLRVELGARAYEIHIGAGLLDRAGALISPMLARPKTAIVTDETVAALHLRQLEEALLAAGIASSSVVVPSGEASKSVAEFGRVCEALLAAGIERRDTIIALGGGVVGDLAGFAAASLHRGVAFVQVPTSLLAQVDSSVGGKTGINVAHGKNLIGAFHQPVLVLADIDVLGTLPARELRAGYAEIVKYAFLGNRGFYDWLEANRDAVLGGAGPALEHAVRESCLAKARIVAEDERESGARGLLNLGHTFGHALEAAAGYSGSLLHGEAVAIGMCLAFDLSARLGFCPADDAARVRRHLTGAGLPTEISALAATLHNRLPDAAGIVELMGRDKKVSGGTKTLVLARGIGAAFLTRDVDDTVLKDFLGEALAP